MRLGASLCFDDISIAYDTAGVPQSRILSIYTVAPLTRITVNLHNASRVDIEDAICKTLAMSVV